jgi:hypothetical protein
MKKPVDFKSRAFQRDLDGCRSGVFRVAQPIKSELAARMTMIEARRSECKPQLPSSHLEATTPERRRVDSCSTSDRIRVG